jgi:hypothetical protein
MLDLREPQLLSQSLLSALLPSSARTMAKAVDQELFRVYLSEVVQTMMGCRGPDVA